MTKLKETTCPVCHHRINGARAIEPGKSIIPRKGDLTMCIYCTTFLSYIDGYQLREMTDEEVADLPHESKMLLLKARRHFEK